MRTDEEFLGLDRRIYLKEMKFGFSLGGKYSRHTTRPRKRQLPAPRGRLCAWDHAGDATNLIPELTNMKLQ
jgi:hypothetical protein